ncbi:DNA-3-methyladenine glycosylase family protein [Arthrobacter sp. H14]|uniref:DNA-3-methyladenine glycosylase family protein n=1 Tax=Arthrobacter sp. H14 TaxID=1312959 RepID=UPI0004B51B73|nr:AlkA N-terminal domain-containing protein [Arthrobacter sp. H14]
MTGDGGFRDAGSLFGALADDGGARGTLHRQLAYTPPYASAPLLGALAAHAIPGMEHAEPAELAHTRTIKTSSGAAVVRVSFQIPGRVELEIQLPPGQLPECEIEEIVRRWLDLDTDPVPVDAALMKHSVLAPMVSARAGLRVLGSVDPFETAVLTVLGQQVSLAAARTFGGRLVEAFGTDAPGGFRAFPNPEVLAAVPPQELQAAIRITGARSRTVHELASAVAVGKLRLKHDGDPVETRASLLKVPGIGPWTADYLAVRVLADPDAYPSGDLVLQRALGVKTAREAVAMSEPWRPYRAYALFHLWTHDSII